VREAYADLLLAALILADQIQSALFKHGYFELMQRLTIQQADPESAKAVDVMPDPKPATNLQGRESRSRSPTEASKASNQK
jgi:hypothetical protein